jgi:hypothetical protein
LNSGADGTSDGAVANEAVLAEPVRHRLLALLCQELARASTLALANGVTPQSLARCMEVRAAKLRSLTLDAEGRVIENVANNADDAIELHGVAD